MSLNSLRVQYPPTLSHQSYPLPPTQTKKKIRSASKLQIGLQVSSLLLFLLRGFCWWDILLPCVTQQFHEQHFKKKGGLGEGRDGPLAILKSAVVPGVVVYLTFTLIYGGIITHSFSTCKLHLKQSGKSPPTSVVNYPWKALRGVDNKIITRQGF